jgi:hypothetical protein
VKITEVLVALMLGLLLLAGLVTFVSHTTRLVQLHPDRFELQQRARVALDLVSRDLRSAGAGVDLGPATGRLAQTFPPVWPRRMGRGGDGPTVARADAITVLTVPDTIAQTVSASDLAPGSSFVVVAPAAQCPPARPACGFTAGTTLAVFDPFGAFGLWKTEHVIDHTLSLRPVAVTAEALGPGSVVTELLVRGYMHDPAARQLRYFDGDATIQTVVDGVTGWAVRYYDALGELPLEVFMDGPWRGSGATLFDADLLRVRRVRVTLTLAMGSQTYQAAMDVSPRNLGDPGGAW